MKPTVLTSKDLKVLFRQLTDQYGAIPPNLKDYAFIKNKDKVYLITRDIDRVPLDNIRVNSIGLYILEEKNTQIRLSIEGAQLFGPHATKNVHELNKEQLRQWFKGEDITVNEEYTGFVILKHGNDYVGSGKYKDGLIFNFVPKARRLQELH